MDLKEIENEINDIFQKATFRQIIFWYDKSKEFEEDINNIQLNNAELHILKKNNLIYTKYYIENEKKDTNFLVYAPFEKPSDEKNYLADMAHYAFPFSADKTDIISRDLNIPKEYHYLLEKYKQFWKSNARLNAFKDLNITHYNEGNIMLAILAVLSNQKMLNFDYIVREVIINNLEEENKLIKSFSKFNILDDFWKLVSKKYNYTDSDPTVKKLIISLILNYTADFYDGEYLTNWKPYIVSNRNNAHIFIDEFMNNSKYSDSYDEISNGLEEFLKINTLKIESIDSYKHCDSFERFDKNIIAHYVDLLTTNQRDLGKEFKEVLEYRKKTHFYPKYENEFSVLKFSNLFISLVNEFLRAELPENSEDIIKVYSEKWTYIDSYYRKFYYHYDKIQNKEIFEELRQLIENMYANSFLSKINPHFTKKLEQTSLNNIGVDKQWKFFRQNVQSHIKKHKTAVIISDGFRYGCAVELYAELQKDEKRQPTIKPMISTIPSHTSLGMAALLPNQKIDYDEKTILVDDKKVSDTEGREAILMKYVPNSKAITARKLNNLTVPDLRETFKGLELIYVYHNQIDYTGDKEISQHKVFDAAQETIAELTKLIKTLVDYGGFKTIIITADHGFIYKRDPLLESDKVDLDSSILYRNKRYLLSKDKKDIFGAVSLKMDYLGMDDLFVTVPLGADIFKAPGNGNNYVHGGSSLEECIVPVLTVKADRGANRSETVGLQLISSSNRITNYEILLTFFQKENISSGIAPLEAKIYFVDENNQKISNEVLINANVSSDNSEDREFKNIFKLSRKPYDKSKNYYLIISDNKESLELERIPFIIDIAFQDDGFDFF